MDGDAPKFQESCQKAVTAVLQEHLSVLRAATQGNFFYRALSFMLIFSLLDTTNHRYEVKMERNHGYGRTNITAHPQTPDCLLSLVFEIKQVATHSMIRAKPALKSADRLKDLNRTTYPALQQIELRQYIARALPCT